MHKFMLLCIKYTVIVICAAHAEQSGRAITRTLYVSAITRTLQRNHL